MHLTDPQLDTRPDDHSEGGPAAPAAPGPSVTATATALTVAFAAGALPPVIGRTVSPYRDPERLLPTDSTATGDERQTTADVRRVLGAWAAGPKPSITDRPRWILEAARTQVAASHAAKDRTGPVRFTTANDVAGAVNKYLFTFAPGPGSVFAGADVTKSLREDLDRVGATRATASHNAHDPHLSWWLPAGLLIDEIRVGPYWDDVVDRWMWRKLLTDIAVGQALASRRGHAFLGVRVLPLLNPATALLVTARADGELTSRPAHTLDLTARPAGITTLNDRPGREQTAGAGAGKHAYPGATPAGASGPAARAARAQAVR